MAKRRLILLAELAEKFDGEWKSRHIRQAGINKHTAGGFIKWCRRKGLVVSDGKHMWAVYSLTPKGKKVVSILKQGKKLVGSMEDFLTIAENGKLVRALTMLKKEALTAKEIHEKGISAVSDAEISRLLRKTWRQGLLERSKDRYYTSRYSINKKGRRVVMLAEKLRELMGMGER